jgi:Chaperone of endosialidase
VMVGAIPLTADAQTIEACYSKANGRLRVVGSTNDCTAGEAPISWNITGPPGPAGTVTIPLILSGSVAGGLVDVHNAAGGLSEPQYGVVASAVTGLFGKGITGVSGEGQVTGVIGTGLVSASRGGRFESRGDVGTGVVGVSSAPIPGTGVQGMADDAVFVPSAVQNPVLGVGVRGSGYIGIIGRGRETATPGFAEAAFWGAGVQGFGYYGVFGRSANGFAGYFDGNVHVTGELSAMTVTQSSDRALKDNFVRVDGRSILHRLGQMPIQSWTYNGERSGIRHIGPTAQDFYEAFGLGGDDRHITTVDEGGVALAAIQSLYELHLEKEREVRALKTELESLKAEVDALKNQRR